MNPKEVTEILLDSRCEPDTEPNRKLRDYKHLIELGQGESPEALILKEWCTNFWGIHSSEMYNTQRLQRFQAFKIKRNIGAKDEKATP